MVELENNESEVVNKNSIENTAQNELEMLKAQLLKSKKQKARLSIMATAVVVVVGAVAFFNMNAKSVSKFDLDNDALQGFLPNKTAEEIQAELNRLLDESMFHVSINPKPILANGKVNLFIENVPANNYWTMVDIYYIDENGDEQLLYQSRVIQNGYYVAEVEIDEDIPKGEYNAFGIFKAILPESTEEIGQTRVSLLLTVQ